MDGSSVTAIFRLRRTSLHGHVGYRDKEDDSKRHMNRAEVGHQCFCLGHPIASFTISCWSEKNARLCSPLSWQCGWSYRIAEQAIFIRLVLKLPLVATRRAQGQAVKEGGPLAWRVRSSYSTITFDMNQVLRAILFVHLETKELRETVRLYTNGFT